MRATFAQLMDHFHYKPWDIGRLTDRQIVELCYHPRTEEGGFEPVAEPVKVKKPSLNGEILAVYEMLSNSLIDQRQADDLIAKLRVKYGGMNKRPGS